MRPMLGANVMLQLMLILKIQSVTAEEEEGVVEEEGASKATAEMELLFFILTLGVS